jgi:hypothetical protein
MERRLVVAVATKVELQRDRAVVAVGAQHVEKRSSSSTPSSTGRWESQPLPALFDRWTCRGGARGDERRRPSRCETAAWLVSRTTSGKLSRSSRDRDAGRDDRSGRGRTGTCSRPRPDLGRALQRGELLPATVGSRSASGTPDARPRSAPDLLGQPCRPGGSSPRLRAPHGPRDQQEGRVDRLDAPCPPAQRSSPPPGSPGPS